jgi:F-type H+-transporting ATPase subunit b
MLIDWFTVGAQALNFIVLVWLLKRFLYKPILNAVAARETLIAAKLADADAKEAEAQKQRDAFQHKNEAFDRERTGLMSKATDAATAEGHKLLDAARGAADALSAQRQEALRTDAASLNQAIRRRTQQEVFAIARRALTELAGASLEERMAEVFTHRLRTMDAKIKATFAAALKTASGPALVRSAFDLPDKQRAAIEKSFDETFSTQVQLRFEAAPDLVSGIELTANGQKLAWSIADYLASLEKGVGELLDEHERPQAKPVAKPAATANVAAKIKAKPATDLREPRPKAAYQ